MRLTVYETRAITIDIDTDNKEFAEEMAMKVYEDNCDNKDLMCVLTATVEDGDEDSVEVYLDKDGDVIKFGGE